ncbi:MAG TPA: spore coat U domain-containing protein [Nevskiaceae bacterium]|nr:spore coat U domain-containing protein [Nevskiaceae bacterium]
MHMRRVGIAGLMVLAAGMPPAATASQATSSFLVTATVLNVCTVTATALPFTNYDPTASGNDDATTTVSVLCTLSTPYTVRLSQGVNGTSVTARKMIRTLGTETLTYSLYRDAARSQNWGVTDGSDTASGTGTGLLQNITVYGRITSGAAVPAGAYTDTVTVTVNY